MRAMRRQLPSDSIARASSSTARVLLAALVLMTLPVGGCGAPKPAEKPAEQAASSAPLPSSPAPAADSGSANAAAVAAAPEDLGAQVFVKRCVLCHGADGGGDGVASKQLNPKPRNFHDLAYMKTRTDAQLSQVIHQGKGAMPRWQGQLTEAEIAAVLAHIRALGNER